MLTFPVMTGNEISASLCSFLLPIFLPQSSVPRTHYLDTYHQQCPHNNRFESLPKKITDLFFQFASLQWPARGVQITS
jgi:hypothetical protein